MSRYRELYLDQLIDLIESKDKKLHERDKELDEKDKIIEELDAL